MQEGMMIQRMPEAKFSFSASATFVSFKEFIFFFHAVQSLCFVFSTRINFFQRRINYFDIRK